MIGIDQSFGHFHSVGLKLGYNLFKLKGTIYFFYNLFKLKGSVSDPLHFDADPDPRIRFRDNGSGSDLNRTISFFFFILFFKCIKLISMFYFVIYELIIQVY